MNMNYKISLVNYLAKRDLPDLVIKSKECEETQDREQCLLVTTPSVSQFSSNSRKRPRKIVNDLSTSTDDNKTSPNLAKLRMTPGILKEKQNKLIDQHKKIVQKGKHLQAGGGISMWPEMQQMRLTKSEVFTLLLQAIFLCGLTLVLLKELHGETFSHMKNFTYDVNNFCANNIISETESQEIFNIQALKWHNDFSHLTENIHLQFDLTTMSASYQVYILTYIVGLLVLFYYLMDNMLAKNKLTPTRVKKWTCLLVVIGTWTCTMAYGLFLASQLERQMVQCVQLLSSFLRTLVISPLNLDTFQAIILYWRTRFLDPSSVGALNLFGLVPMKDLLYYLQYYSVPIATVLLSPVIHLCCACLTVYGNGEYIQVNL